MAINLDALSPIHPLLGQNAGGHLPDTAHILRAETTAPAPIADLDFGYGPAPSGPIAPDLVEIDERACSYGQHRNGEGKQTVIVDQTETLVPWRVTFRNSPDLDVRTGDFIGVGGMNLKVIVPPQPGSFDVLTKALCQEIE